MQARNVYYTGLDWEPKNRELLDALVSLLADGDDAAERADVLERRLALEQGPAAESMANELAHIRDELGDPQGAQRAIELGFRGHPASAELRSRLESRSASSASGRSWPTLRVLDATGRVDVGERVARLREAASAQEDQLRDARGAAEALRLAREAAPEDASVLVELVDMLVDARDPAAAVARAHDGHRSHRRATTPERTAMLATRRRRTRPRGGRGRRPRGHGGGVRGRPLYLRRGTVGPSSVVARRG